MNYITLVGKIVFEPDNVTKKHNLQSSWKRVAMIMFDGEITEYYSWFINRRYNLKLNRPIRGAHISFINDSMKDLTLNGERSNDEVNELWEKVKAKWDGKEIEVVLDLDVRSDSNHWWLNVPHEERESIHSIRAELGLGKPFYGLHMSLGYANEKYIDHSKYIHGLIQRGFIIN